MILGLDYLGGARYPDLILREHPHGWAAGFISKLDGFGDALPVAEKLIKTGRCPLVKFHLRWKDNHDFSEADIRPTVRECERVFGLVKKYPNVKFLISPWLEHKANLSLLQRLDRSMPRLPSNAKFLNTPLPDGAVYGSLNEFHGHAKRRGIGKFTYSSDGDSIVDMDVEGLKKAWEDSEVLFLWHSRFNGRWNTNDKTPRAQRKGWPDSKLIDSVIYLHQERGAVSLPPRWLLKSHAENKGPNPKTGKIDPRADKLMFIAPPKVDRIELVAANGQVVDVLPRYKDPYRDGRWRYYSTNYGFEVSEKAKRIQKGDPVVSVRAGGKIVGRVNCAFRMGDFR